MELGDTKLALVMGTAQTCSMAGDFLDMQLHPFVICCGFGSLA